MYVILIKTLTEHNLKKKKKKERIYFRIFLKTDTCLQAII